MGAGSTVDLDACGPSGDGMPVHPECYSDEFGRLLRRVGLRLITLHDSRQTTLTLMEHAGALGYDGEGAG